MKNEERDKWIGRLIMGFCEDSTLFQPSSDIGNAFIVVNKMIDDGYTFILDKGYRSELFYFDNGLSRYYICTFFKQGSKMAGWDCKAKTASEAISIAALAHFDHLIEKD